MRTVVSKLQEPAELILYGGILAFLVMVLLKIRSDRALDPPSGS